MASAVTLIQQRIIDIWQSFVLLVPNLISASVFLLVAWYGTKSIARLIGRVSTSRNRPDLGSLLGSVARAVMLVFAILIAAAMIFPTIHPGDVFATLGVGSVAIGFAFKDILQNLLAGFLLLIQRPYERGDQIIVKGFEGVVVQIESRATLLRMFDGRQVIIPNSDVYTSPVTVKTAAGQHREELMVGIGYGDKIPEAIEIFRAAVRGLDGVADQPGVEVWPWALNDSTIDLKIRWWNARNKTNNVETKARVIVAVAQAAKNHGIDLPFPTSVVLLHDQSEESDGDRKLQREGWPAGSNPPNPRRQLAPSAVD